VGIVASRDDGLSAIALSIERASDSFAAGMHQRFLDLLDVPAELTGLRTALAEGSISPTFLLLQIVLTVAMVSVIYVLVGGYFQRVFGRKSGWRSLLSIAAAGAVALAVGVVAASLISSGLTFRILRLWVAVTAVGGLVMFLIRFFLVPRNPGHYYRSSHLLAFSRDMSVGIGWVLMGVALVGTVELLGGGQGIDDFARTVLVGLPAYALFAGAVLRHRRTLVSVVAGNRPRSPHRSNFARAWPAIVISLLAITFLSTQAALTMGAPLPGPTVVLTVLVFIATPHLDAMIEAWAQSGLESPGIAIFDTAGRQTVRFTILIITVSLLGIIWAAPLALALGFDLRSVARDAIGIVVVALIAAFLWNVVGTMSSRTTYYERQALGAPAGKGIPRSRLGTIIPLLSGAGKSSIVALALLSVLVWLGFNVWPLITGLSVFGLAVGFGCQALVKDIVSGPFFLIDDSFRFGEYIEMSGAKGTVEKISVRSVSLRSAEGSIVTVPYGQIGTIENFSRDWAVETLVFRLAFDTDVELVLHLFDRIGEDLARNPQFFSDLLQPFKGTGISDVEDGTLIVSAEFTAKPGRQGSIRRAALKAIHAAFRDNGIRTVHKLQGAGPEPETGG
jgi:moderate conductance mechanosensitive channel